MEAVVDIEKLSSPELIALAESKGLAREIRGMTVGGVRDLLRNTESVVETGDNIESPPALESLSWPDIKNLAKEKGINTFKKSRGEIEALLKATGGETNLLLQDAQEMVVTSSLEVQVLKLTGECKSQAIDINKLEQRLDRIAEALGVKGM